MVVYLVTRSEALAQKLTPALAVNVHRRKAHRPIGSEPAEIICQTKNTKCSMSDTIELPTAHRSTDLPMPEISSSAKCCAAEIEFSDFNTSEFVLLEKLSFIFPACFANSSISD
ncbi:MAG: hypothetical protein IJP43_07325 [Oscillospiraceae bacterium]|nr:hypothetical protein [Oscillospiraceae bacterium]